MNIIEATKQLDEKNMMRLPFYKEGWGYVLDGASYWREGAIGSDLALRHVKGARDFEDETLATREILSDEWELVALAKGGEYSQEGC